MKRLAVAALLAAVVLTLASCGGNSGGGNGGGMEGMDHGGAGKQNQKEGGGMAGTGHSNMGGMDHGKMGSGDMAAMSRKMVTPNGKYSDKAFIDAMVPHHEGAVEMAKVASKHAEHPEIKKLAKDIVSAQEKEIGELKDIKEQEYGTSNVPMQMSDQQMRGMGMTEDPQQLANEKPFDRAFIDAMTPHHESAIEMARVAENKTDNPRIRELAKNIISAQQREIAQMKQWRQQWYPEG